MTCETCRFYIVLDDGKPHCKRYPPRALAAMPYFADGKQQCQIIIDFPTLNRMEACGEWRDKDDDGKPTINVNFIESDKFAEFIKNNKQTLIDAIMGVKAEGGFAAFGKDAVELLEKNRAVLEGER